MTIIFTFIILFQIPIRLRLSLWLKDSKWKQKTHELSQVMLMFTYIFLRRVPIIHRMQSRLCVMWNRRLRQLNRRWMTWMSWWTHVVARALSTFLNNRVWSLRIMIRMYFALEQRTRCRRCMMTLVTRIGTSCSDKARDLTERHLKRVKLLTFIRATGGYQATLVFSWRIRGTRVSILDVMTKGWSYNTGVPVRKRAASLSVRYTMGSRKC